MSSQLDQACGGDESDAATEIATEVCNNRFLSELCSLKASVDFPQADTHGHGENTVANLSRVHGIIQEKVSAYLARRTSSPDVTPNAAVAAVERLRDDLEQRNPASSKIPDWIKGMHQGMTMAVDALRTLPSAPEPDTREAVRVLVEALSQIEAGNIFGATELAILGKWDKLLSAAQLIARAALSHPAVLAAQGKESPR